MSLWWLCKVALFTPGEVLILAGCHYLTWDSYINILTWTPCNRTHGCVRVGHLLLYTKAANTLPHQQNDTDLPGEHSTHTRKLEMMLTAIHAPANCCNHRLTPQKRTGSNQSVLMMASAAIRNATRATNICRPVCCRSLQCICRGEDGQLHVM